MAQAIFDSEIFENVDYTSARLATGIYESCIFRACSFNSSDLSDVSFSDCQFHSCDISLAQLHNAVFKDVKFISCKLLGLHFDDCNKLFFSVDFEECNLNLASFSKLKIKGRQFQNCSLNDTDFARADLTGTKFYNCDMRGAIFESTILEKSDLSTSFNFLIDPENNRLKKARFSLQGIPGLLGKYDIVIE